MKKTRLIGILIGLTITLAILPSANAADLVFVSPTGETYKRGDTLTIEVATYVSDDTALLQIKYGSTIKWVDQGHFSPGNFIYTMLIPDNWGGGTYTIHVKGDTGSVGSTTFYLSVPSGGGYTPPPSAAPPTAEELEDMSAADAADELLSLNDSKAAELLSEVSDDFAAKILGKLTTEEATDILEAGVDDGLADELGPVINDLDDESAATLLLEIDPESGADLVEAMADDDLEEAAKTVEAAVKKRLSETDPEKAQEILDKIAETLDNTDTDALVDIFVEIANLPETPETVATVMEAMEVTKVLDVVSAWVDAGSLEELAEVFGYFTEDFLETVYLGMTTAERTALYPYLSEEIVAALPDLGEFEVSSLSISPETVEPGEVVTISVNVENVGTGTSTYTVNLKIDGTTEESTQLTLAADEDETVTWTVSKTAAKTYDVDVNGLTGSFTVEEPVPPVPAEFELSNLVVSPASVETGETVTVSVTVANVGEESGSYTAELLVDESKVDEETVTLV
jgi:DNA-directed RNA polymerase subunit F